MTSNKKLVTMLLFVGALTVTFASVYVSTFLIGATDLSYIMTVTQLISNLNFIAGLLTLSTIAFLISDMN
jgi:hypothetical protein